MKGEKVMSPNNMLFSLRTLSSNVLHREWEVFVGRWYRLRKQPEIWHKTKTQWPVSAVENQVPFGGSVQMPSQLPHRGRSYILPKLPQDSIVEISFHAITVLHLPQFPDSNRKSSGSLWKFGTVKTITIGINKNWTKVMNN